MSKTARLGRGAFIACIGLSGGLPPPGAQVESVTSGERPELAVQLGHGRVESMSVSPDGKLVATASQDGSIRLWDARTGMQARTLVGHEDQATLVRFAADARLLVSHARDKRVRVWDLRSGAQIRTFAGSPAAVSPDGRMLGWATAGNQVQALPLGAAENPRTLGSFAEQAWNFVMERSEPAELTRLSFSPDGRLLVGASSSGTLRLWDVARGKQVRAFEGHTDLVAWFAVLASSDVMVSAGSVIKPGCPCPPPMPNMCVLDREGVKHSGQHLHFWDLQDVLRWWDLRTGRVLRTIDVDEAGAVERNSRFAVSPDGRLLAGRGRDKHVRVWDTADGSLVWSQALEGLDAIQFSSDGAFVSGESRNGLWLLESRTGETRRPLEALASTTAVAFSPDAEWIVGATIHDDLLRASTATGAVAWRSEPGAHTVDTVAWGGDGRFMASGTSLQRPLQVAGANYSTRHLIQVWDLESGQLSRRFTGHPASVAFSPDGRQLYPHGPTSASELNRMKLEAHAKGVSADGSIGLQNAATGSLARLFQSHLSKPLSSVSFSADGRVMVAASGLSSFDFDRDRAYEGDKRLRAWDVTTGRLLLAEPQSTLSGIEIVAAAVSPDGRFALGSIGREVAVYDVTTKERVRTLAGPREEDIIAMAASPDGRSVVVSHGPALRLWNFQTGVLERSWDGAERREGGRDDILSVAFSPDGQRIASATRDSTVRLWDRANGRQVAVLRGHSGSVTDVAFGPGGRGLVSGGDDGTIRFWDTGTGASLAVAVPLAATTAEWAVAAQNGLFDGTQRGIRSLVAWRFAGNETAPLETFFSEFYQPGLLAEIAKGRLPAAPRDIAALDRRQPHVVLGQRPAAGPSRRVALEVSVREAAEDGDHSLGSGARDVRLFRNGSLVKAWRGDVLAGQPSTTLTAEVPIVAGPNRFTAYAFNRDNIKSPDAELVVPGDASLARKGTAYVLAIGINQYANRDYDLRYAVPDAQAFGAEIARQQAGLGIFGEVVVTPLHDQEATRANILRALARLAGEKAPLPADAPRSLSRLQAAQPEDAVFVYYAGHGTSSGSRFYLIPHDLGYTGSRAALDAEGLEAILRQGISDRELELAFEGVDASRLLLVIDACNSGQALEAEEKRRGPMNSKGLAQLAYEKGMYVLTAAQGYQAALEVSQLGHGLLTYALVEEGLKAGRADAEPADGRVVLQEWLDYATRRVPELQATAMRSARSEGRELAFVGGEEAVPEVEARSLQRPRVFYRREPETEPLVVAGRPEPGRGATAKARP